MFKLFEYKDKQFKVVPSFNYKNIKGFFISSIIVIVITSLAGWLKLEEKDLWKIYNLLIQRFDLNRELPDLKNNEKKLEAEIEVEVDRAIKEYERLTGYSNETRIPLPRLIEKGVDNSVCYTKECKILGGEMRLCSPWREDCI